MFQLDKEADNWAAKIFKTGPFRIKFDYYYLFLLVGLLTKKSEAIKGEKNDLVDNFPSDYKQKQKIIINLLLIAEKERLAIPDDSKSRITNELLEKYIDPDTSSLNYDGRSLCNDYANYGFRTISEKMPKPEDCYDFLSSYTKLIKEISKDF